VTIIASVGDLACVPTGGQPASGATGLSCDGAACLTSPPVDCVAAERGLEFTPFMIADFEALGQNVGFGKAQYLYDYADDTATIRYPETPDITTGYEPPSIPTRRCLSSDPGDISNHVFHIVGGPFRAWGGGMGISMEHLYSDSGVCPAAGPEFCPPDQGRGTIDHLALDLSQWDGVAVWARRASNSQALLRVLVGDRHTDEDVSFWEYQTDPGAPRECERVRDCACLGDLTCDHYDDDPAGKYLAGYYCGLPGSSSGIDVTMGTGQVASSYDNTCNRTRCDDIYPAYGAEVDNEFHGRACTPYALRDGTQSSFCFDPGKDSPPATSDQRCGDHFTYPLHLTTEWQLYLAPFSAMSQQGWAKKAPFLDLKSVSVVRLTWDVGNIDYYVDNWRFYRVQR
jgi:hypothetical protein